MPLDLSFASKNWLKSVYAKDEPGMLVRRHFEMMVFIYIVEELRCGDITVAGCEGYGDWARSLLDLDTCVPKVEEFCAQAACRTRRTGSRRTCGSN